MLSKLPHHDIIILFQNDSYLPYYRKYTRKEIYMGWHDAAFQSKNYDTETYKKVQNNSYKIARRSIILLQVGVGFLIPFALTIVMGFIYTIAAFRILVKGSQRVIRSRKICESWTKCRTFRRRGNSRSSIRCGNGRSGNGKC